MSLITFFVVLVAALLHATWNALIKVSGDRLAIMAVITGSTSLLVIPLLFVFPLPDKASWPYLGASALIHSGYMLILVKAYSHGDFSQIYPVARGSAPLLTAILGFVFVGEKIAGLELLGMLLIVGGIIAFAFENSIRKVKKIDNKVSSIGIALSLLVGLSITAYSLVDGLGARVSGNAFSFIAWSFFLDGFIVAAVAYVRRRNQIRQTILKVWKPGLLVALISTIAYGLVVWSFTLSPIGLVATLRETSVLFALLISAFLIREKISRYRVIMSVVVLLGIGLIGAASL